MHEIQLTRPGPCSLAWLQAAVADLQVEDRLARVTVVVPSPYLGLVARQALAARGCANVRTAVLREVAAQVAGDLGDTHRGPLSGVLEGAAIRAAVHDLRDGVFGGVAHQRALHDALGALFRELRHEDDADAALDAVAEQGPVAAAAVAAFRRFRDLSRDYYDVPALAHLAASAARRRARWANDVGALVLYLPPRLDAAEIAMLGQIGRHVPVVAAFAHFGDALADGLQEATARHLAAALGLAAPEAPVEEGPHERACTLFSAPDAAEEVRGVVRRVAADLTGGVPLWRIGVLYGAEEPYGALVREALDAAALPWQGALGRPVAAGWAARTLVGLLGLREGRFARDAVLDWLAARPPSEAREGSDPLPRVPPSAWERLSRRAQVLEGPRQWVQRFTTLAGRLAEEAARRERPRAEAEGEPAEAPWLADAAYAHAIARAMAQLDEDTRPPPDGAPWDQFVDWARRLRARYAPIGAAWPPAERAAAEALDAALESLGDAAAFEPGTTLRTFRQALVAALESRRLPEGRAGSGVVVGPVGAVLGAALDRVYVVGLAEGVLPGRFPPDPLASAEPGADPLQRRQRGREADRRTFLGALAAADEGRVLLSYPRSDGGARARYPSRWFLECAARAEGRSVYTSDLPRLFAEGRPWLVRVESPQDGLVRLPAPGDLDDRRLASVVAWQRAGRDLAAHPLAQRADLPLGAALRAGRARRSRVFTPYDGNLAELAGLSRQMTRAITHGPASATSVERWATCPFQYLLVNVLRVQATQRPEEEWTITPLVQGNVVHEVLEAFFRELHASGRFRDGDPFTPGEHARLDALAEEAFERLEAEGRTGHPLAWENARARILADLHALLEREDDWRATEDWRPGLFERPFGFPDAPTAWPPATVTLRDGRTVAFRGLIDRVDFSPPRVAPRRALIIDYKTGGADRYKDIEKDPLLGGRHVQLALYARALRAALPPEQQPREVHAEFRFVSAKGEFKRLGVTVDERLDAALDAVVQVAADGIGRGVFLPQPGERGHGGFDNCRWCDYDRVCSTTRDEMWERKHAEAGR